MTIQTSEADKVGDGVSLHLAIPSLYQAAVVWAKIGILSFGGPAAQIALMHRILVDEKGWISDREYLNALSFCMLLPGPEAMQQATYVGWRLHGTIGGLIAGLLFVIPGALIVLGLAIVYSLFGDVSLMSSIFLGIKAAVLIVVIEALLRVARKALHRKQHWVIAAASFVGIFFLDLPYPLIIVSAAIIGFFSVSQTEIREQTITSSEATASFKQTLSTILVWMAIWVFPFLLLGYWNEYPILSEIGEFFSRLAVVTFGGAYAVLAYLAQDVVNQFGWLSAGEMIDGLGLAETTPGPLILVTEFVGFIAAYRDGGLLIGLTGALVTLWVTFVPCFLWIFAGAPYIAWIGTQPRLKGALSAITAAVVGVILNLSIWFALQVFFYSVERNLFGPFILWLPDPGTLDWRALLLAATCALLVFKWHWNIVGVLVLASITGFILSIYT
ncbi:MAG: chromate efflux transporter [Gammaproteobacteria bacterium]|nr:chromate efflux transporter [Gammaproteobacteria bacterium]